MERADIKLAIDMVNHLDCDDDVSLQHVMGVLEDCGNEIAKLRAELAEAKKDAARYQHLRTDESFAVDVKCGKCWEPVHYEELDAAIDAAMKEQPCTTNE